MEKEQKNNIQEELKAIKEFTGNDNVSFIDIDDTFGFKCQQCGKCCMNRTDIILNPFDVYNGSKYLGITPTEFLDKYCHIDLGAHSKIPMVLLRTTSNGFCPLLKYDIKDGGKFKCMIHAAKPGACSNHPIGVVYNINKETGESNTRYIKVEQCNNSVSDEQQLVRDWVQPYISYQEEINVAHKVQHLVTDHFDSRKFWLSLAFLRERFMSIKDGEISKRIETIMSHYLSMVIGVGYTNYDINKSFIEQAEENIKSLNDFYTNTKQLFEALKISFESVTGKKFEEEMKSNKDKGEGITNDSDN